MFAGSEFGCALWSFRIPKTRRLASDMGLHARICGTPLPDMNTHRVFKSRWLFGSPAVHTGPWSTAVLQFVSSKKHEEPEDRTALPDSLKWAKKRPRAMYQYASTALIFYVCQCGERGDRGQEPFTQLRNPCLNRRTHCPEAVFRWEKCDRIASRNSAGETLSEQQWPFFLCRCFWPSERKAS